MNPFMKCGHIGYAKDKDGNPCCVICAGSTPDAFIVEDNQPNLAGRKARCLYCGSLKDSSPDLPFFEYRPDRKFDGFYDGCKGWD